MDTYVSLDCQSKTDEFSLGIIASTRNDIQPEDYICKGRWHVKPWKTIEFINHKTLENTKRRLMKNIAASKR